MCDPCCDERGVRILDVTGQDLVSDDHHGYVHRLKALAGAAGDDPDKDIETIVVPPPQMVANMKVDKMDGFCVGEPWNLRAIADGRVRVAADASGRLLGFSVVLPIRDGRCELDDLFEGYITHIKPQFATALELRALALSYA